MNIIKWIVYIIRTIMKRTGINRKDFQLELQYNLYELLEFPSTEEVEECIENEIIISDDIVINPETSDSINCEAAVLEDVSVTEVGPEINFNVSDEEINSIIENKIERDCDILSLSIVGIELIKKYEGFKSLPYLCPAKVPTIGYGATFYEDGSMVTMNDGPISKERADELFSFVIDLFSKQVNSYIKVKLNQNQYDAIISLVYNIGITNFSKSTLLKRINEGNFSEAANQILRWNKSKGVILNGLVNRRNEERNLFIL